MRDANATSVGKEPAMRKHVPALAALATSILMVSCAADPAGAREQASMSAANKDSALPFHDPAVVPLAEAVARGDTARIAALAPATDLSARGEANVTLLARAISRTMRVEGKSVEVPVHLGGCTRHKKKQ